MINGVFSKCIRNQCITSLFKKIYPNLLVRHIITQKLKMNEAFLRYTNGNETFDFTFRYINEDLNIDRQFNLSRRKSETVGAFLNRLNINLEKIIGKKMKKRMKKNPSMTVEKPAVDNIESGNITIMKEQSIIGLDEPCSKLIEDPSQLSMIILGVPYTIKYNAPCIINMKLPKCLLMGFPVYPSELETLYVDKNKSKFTWYRTDYNGNKIIWKKIGEGYIYIPTSDDIGTKLKLSCLPCNEKLEGPEIEVESTCTVEAGPGPCPFELRQIFTEAKLSGNNFRITSYNILANIYADSDHSRDVLFPYCPPYAMAIDYRKLLIMKELIGYNSDIICLQEVDKKIYENDFKPTLSSLNYESVYNTKGELSEGLAIIFNKNRFELLDTAGTVMSESIDSNKKFKAVWEKITNENVQKRFIDRNTSVLITVLRSLDNPMEILVIGNTHLYFHPDADHIRLLQAYHALTSCQESAAKIREKHPEYNVTLMLCGDFNSTPIDGVYELMTKNCIPENHKDWSSNADQKVENVSLTHDLSLASACGTPEFTNFTIEFADCLDYVFYESDKLIVSEVLPMPSKEELTLHSAIPSVVFPSDHIAICADMKWIHK